MPATPSATAIQPTTLKPLPPLAAVERNECPQCETPIPQQYAFNRFDFEQSPATRSVTIYCSCCRRFYEKDFELRGGVWCATSDVRVTTHAARLKSLRRKVAEIANISLAQSA